MSGSSPDEPAPGPTPEDEAPRLRAGEERLDLLAAEDGGALLELRARGAPPLRAHGGHLAAALLVGVPALLGLLVLGAIRRAVLEGGEVSVRATWRTVTVSVDRTRTGERPAVFLLPGPLVSAPNPLFPVVRAHALAARRLADCGRPRGGP